MVAALVAGPLPGRCDILIGQTTGVTGNSADNVRETMAGAALLIDDVNRKGGVGGQKIVLLTKDDGGNAEVAAENARKLIVDDKVIALFMVRGTPQNEAILPLLDRYGVPEVAPSTGAMVLSTPVKKYIFNVRGSYQLEAERGLMQLADMGIVHIAVLKTADSFGADSYVGVQRGLTNKHLEPVLIADFDKAKPDFTAIAPRVLASHAQAVVVLGTGSAVVKATQQLRQAGSGATIVTLSNNASAGFVRALGKFARGVVITQVYPGTHETRVPLIRDAQAMLRANGGGTLTPAMLEGYAAAQVLIEGLRRSGAHPSPTSLEEALDTMSAFDLGGLTLHYSPTNHSGLNYAGFSVVDESGNIGR